MSTENKMELDMIFLKPEKFEDCVKCAQYIKEDKIVNMNLSQLDERDSRRVLDYVSGSIFITGAEIINVGNKVFCSVPKTIKFEVIPSVRENSFRDGYSNEEEEIVPLKKQY